MNSYFNTATVGEIVADNFNAANVFAEYGIDFCCHGNRSFMEAVKEAGLNPETVEKAIDEAEEKPSMMPDFRAWPLDKVVDYVVEIYHSGIRVEGPKIKALLNKVTAAHGEAHPVLYEVQELFDMSLTDLLHHIRKEEQVLFPYIYQMCEAQRKGLPLPLMHCGSVANPIEVMMIEHEAEDDRYRHITDLTGGYSTPADGCKSYRLLMDKMREFNEMLHQHIHIENNIIFPEAKAMEMRLA